MRIIGCDYHPSWQQVCWMETTTGETGELSLQHASGEAERSYRQLPGPALIGMESTGNCQWIAELLARLGHGTIQFPASGPIRPASMIWDLDTVYWRQLNR